jgi:hypothetical protein
MAMRKVGMVDAEELLERTGKIYDLCNEVDELLGEADEEIRVLIKQIRDVNTKNNMTAGFMQASFSGEIA